MKAVDTGISRDSALSVMTKDAAAPVVATGANAAPVDKEPPNVYRRDQYLVNGVSTEVLYFDSKNRHLGQIDKDTVPWKDLTPVVMVNNKVMGKGWDFWDDLAKRNKLPMHKH